MGMNGSKRLRTVRRRKSQFPTARAAWMDIAKVRGVKASQVQSRDDSPTHFVFKIK